MLIDIYVWQVVWHSLNFIKTNIATSEEKKRLGKSTRTNKDYPERNHTNSKYKSTITEYYDIINTMIYNIWHNLLTSEPENTVSCLFSSQVGTHDIQELRINN